MAGQSPSGMFRSGIAGSCHRSSFIYFSAWETEICLPLPLDVGIKAVPPHSALVGYWIGNLLIGWVAYTESVLFCSQL